MVGFSCASTWEELQYSGPFTLKVHQCAHQGLNLGPTDYESVALTN